jgi:hypothetical protein
MFPWLMKTISEFHKQITLPDTTDTLILVTRIARRSGLKPMLPEAEQFSTVLDFV